MAVVKMKKVFIFSFHSWQDEIIKILHESGLVQICQVQKTDEEGKEVLKEVSSPDVKDIEEKINKLQFLLSFLPPLPSEKKDFVEGMINARKLVDKGSFGKSVSGINWEKIFSRCIEIEHELEEIKRKKDSLQNTKEQLLPWINLDLSLNEIENTERTFIISGKVEVEDFSSLTGEFASETKNFVIKEISRKGKDKFFVLIGFPEDKEKILNFLKKYNYSNIVLPKSKNTPREAVAETKKNYHEISAREKILSDERDAFSENRGNLINLHDYFLWQKDKLIVRKNFGQTEKITIIDGWIKAIDIEKLKEKLCKLGPEIYIYSRDPSEGEDVPITLKNNRVFAPFELIVELYGMPNYYEKDPTPLIAIFFSIIFGFCLGDAVYGIVLAIIASQLVKKYKIHEDDKKGIKLFFWVGITTIILGALTGTWMGDLPDKFSGSFGFIKDIKNALMIVDPLNQLILFIAIALGVGVIQIFCGLGFKAYQSIVKGKFFDALFDQIVWITLVGGLIGWAVSKTGIIPFGTSAVFSWVAKISALTIILFGGRDIKNPFGRVGMGVYKLYGVSAYIGDILSYVRLVALSLAGSIIAMVFNIMALLLKDSYIGFIFLLAILFVGHSFNLVINMLGAFVHTARLHYVEFFGKFYDNGGKPFKPFRMEGKYVVVE